MNEYNRRKQQIIDSEKVVFWCFVVFLVMIVGMNIISLFN